MQVDTTFAWNRIRNAHWGLIRGDVGLIAPNCRPAKRELWQQATIGNMGLISPILHDGISLSKAFGERGFTVAQAQPILFPRQSGERARQRTKAVFRLLRSYELISRKKGRGQSRPGRPPYVYRISNFGHKHLNYIRTTVGYVDFWVLAEQKKDVKEFCVYARRALRKALETGYGGETWTFASEPVEFFISFYEKSREQFWRDWVLASLAFLNMHEELLRASERSDPMFLAGKFQHLRRQFQLAMDRLRASSKPTTPRRAG